MSWKAEVVADATKKWIGNRLRFATQGEAARYVADLMMRWTAVEDTRVLESEDAVNAAIVNDKLEHL